MVDFTVNFKMKGLILTATSFALTATVLGHAYVQKKQFYPSVVYITKSNPSLAVLYLQAFVIVILMGKLFKKVFFGQLRAAEMEHLIERSWYAVTETCLAFTVFRDDFSPRFVAMFTLLLFLKCFHWLAEDRVDYMERSPVISWLFHLRVLMLLAVLGFLDFMFINYAYHSTLTKGASVQLVFGFEYAILLTVIVNVFFKYILHTIDLQSENPWESKAVYMLYTDLILGFIKVFLYTAFVAIMIKIHTFPLFAIRPMYLAMRSFKKAVHDVIMSRRAIRNMNTLYPDATAEDLASTDNICIICREEMVVAEAGGAGGGACKKLPCGHIFHSSCLRSWFQRQQTCPTCRMDVLRLSVAAASQRLRQQQGQGQAGQAAPGGLQQGQQGLAPGQQMQGQGMPPFPPGFPFWMPPFQAGAPFPQPPVPPTPSATQEGSAAPSSTTDGAGTTAAGSTTATPTTPGTSLPNFPPPPVSSAFPFLGFPPMLPFGMPPPMPPPNLSGLSDIELQAMEGMERQHVQARVECLKNIQTLLDAAVIQMQQYTTLINRMGIPMNPGSTAATNTTSATTTVPTPTVQTRESSSTAPETLLSTTARADGADNELSDLEGAVGFTPPAEDSEGLLASAVAAAAAVEEEIVPDEADQNEIRRRRLRKLSETPVSSS
ncbi:E3 ubiquitin-protein ligase synoviolin B-like [Diadema antillarum]|uniref:E3 ubiquitin-protein ligase synoviolin B-like n=1 Tax=Diadema antillarum TaxID=105358 RepID=UPI003A88BB70